MKTSAVQNKTLRFIGKRPRTSTVLFISLSLCFLNAPWSYALTMHQYGQDMKQDMVRGFKNILGAPVEIPIAIQKYHERAGLPLVRQGAGFFEGSFKTVERLGSGVLDVLLAFWPGSQQGLPLKPQTLF